MANIVTHLGQNLNWTAYKNGHNNFTITLTEAGDAFDISDYVFVVNITKVGGTTNLLQLTEASGITNGGAAGTLAIALTQTQASTTLPGSDYWYEIAYTKDSKVYPFLQGSLTLSDKKNPESTTTSVSVSVSLAGSSVSAAITLAGSDGDVTSESITTALGYTPFNPETTRTANTFYGGPTSGSAAAPTFRVPSHFNKVFHVEDYGAVADSDGTTGNGTDNLTAITNAVSAMTTNGGGILRFGEGIYRTTGRLYVNNFSNCVIEGMGQGVSTLFYDSTTNTAHIQMIGNYNHVRDITVKGRRSFTSAGVGVSVCGSYCSVTRTEVREANCFGIFVNGFGTTVTDLEVSNCNVHDCAADGIHVAYNISRVNICNNIIYNNADDGIGVGFEGSAKYVNLTNNIIFQTSAGIAIMGYSASGVATDVQYINATGNIIYNTWLAGITLHITQGSLANVNITGNQISSAGHWTPGAEVNMRGQGVAAGITIRTESSNTSRTISDIIVSGNQFRTCRSSFIAVGCTGSTWGIARNIKITDNLCTSNQTVGGAGAALGTMGGASSNPAPATYAGIIIANTINSSANFDVSNNTFRAVYEESIRIESTALGQFRVANNFTVAGNSNNTAGSAYICASTNASTIVEFTNNTSVSPSNAYSGQTTNIFSGCTITAFNDPQSKRNAQTGTSYTVLARDVGKVIGLSSTSARTITFPAASIFPSGQGFTIVDEGGNAGTNSITCNRAGSDTINGATSNVISTNYGARSYYSNGSSAWFVRE